MVSSQPIQDVSDGMGHYVYSHCDIDNGQCFYIGHGKNDRVLSPTGRGDDWSKRVYSGNGYTFRILVSGLSKEKAKEVEQSFIDQIGIENLTNRGFKGRIGRKKGCIPWNKGLTKADPRVARNCRNFHGKKKK